MALPWFKYFGPADCEVFEYDLGGNLIGWRAHAYAVAEPVVPFVAYA